ncbi:ferredoxin reductase-like protein [Gyrodon lividus]|nr:ferredoxin reductase-like protein [Gyrodon lividus]
MSFIRAATLARSAAVSTRLYSTEAATIKKSKFPLYLFGAVVASAGAYGYATYESKAEEVEPKKGLTSPLDPQNFIDITLKKVEPYNHNTSKFVFDLGDGKASLLPVTSCVYLKTEDFTDAKGKPMYRPYTPISASDLEGELTFIIKKYETGNVSKYIHSLKPGDKLAVKGPLPKWSWKMNEFDEVGLIGGGSGIAPLYQVLQHALADKTNKTKFKLIFANVTEADILLREEFDAMKKKYPNSFDVVYVLDKPPANWNGPSGYVTADLIKQHIAPPSLGEKVKVFVCGPPPQVTSLAGKKDGPYKQGELTGILKELGYTADQVYKF